MSGTVFETDWLACEPMTFVSCRDGDRIVCSVGSVGSCNYNLQVSNCQLGGETDALCIAPEALWAGAFSL
jgi:hypothetical protein